MNAFRTLSLLLLLSFASISVLAQSPTSSTDLTSLPAYQAGKVYVKLKDNANVVLPEYKKGDQRSNYPLIADLLQSFGVERVFRPFPLLKGSTFQNTYQINFSTSVDANSLLRTLAALDAVEYAEKVPAEYIMVDPNDPKENDGSLWYLAKVKAHQAWDLGLGSSNVVVAVVDDAVYTQHEDVNLWVNPNEIANNNIDDDGNGYVDDINGYDVADSDNNTNPPAALVASTSFAHGSHCASVVAARTNNALGVASIGYGIRVMGVKATSDGGSPTMITHGWQGIQYAIAAGADVISLSWGGTSSSTTYQNIINNAEAQGITFVAAAGNSSVNTPFYPAAYDKVIAVAATDQSDVKASYSNYGSWIDIAAPGNIIHGILATGPSNYGIKSGTSMAAPVVASAIGLMISNNPAITPAQIRTCLSNGADNIDATNSTYIGQLGAGRLNIQNSLVCAMPSNACVTPYNLNANVTGTSATLTWNASGTSFSIRWRETGASTWNTATATTTSQTITVGMCKSYEFEVMANCSGGNSAYSATKTFQTLANGPQNYCSQTAASTFGWIQSVSFAGIVNASGNNNGYVNATCSSASVSPGSSYSIALTPGFPSYPYGEYWKVFIDYNQDGDFNDTGELAYESGTAAISTVNGNIAIPSTALQGTTRMRILMKWIGSGDTNLPTVCTAYNYGEVEDYSVFIATNNTATTCNAPTGLAASNISAAGATLSWTATAGANNYVVEYKTLSATTWTNGGTVTATSLSLNTLIANTTYQFRVTASCSIASSSVNFTTAATACNAPSSLTTTNVTANSATLNWGTVATASAYNIRVKPTATSTWSISYGIPTTTVNSSNLSSGTAYEFQIASDCGNGVTSAYSASQNFTTAQATCSAPASISSSNISTSTALISWTAATSASNYTIRYRIQNAASWSSELTTTTNSYQMAGLQAATAYEFQVKTNCSTGSSSGYTGSYVFSTASPTCAAPTNPVLSNIAANSMTLSWTAASGASTYAVRYKTTAATTWTTLAATNSLSSTISGLTASTTYEFQVATNCSSNSSSYTSSVSATTSTACALPTNLSAASITTTGASLNWTNVSGASNYSIQYKTTAATTWTSTTAYTNTLALSALNSNTAYEFKVQTNCSNSTNSGYSAAQSFTTATPVSCDIPTSLATSNLQPTSADATWATVTNANSYNVRYKPATSSTWTTIASTSNSKNITGLTAFTIYNVQVQAVCSNTQSTYTASSNFTTPSLTVTSGTGCGVPSNLAVSNIGSSSATLAWTTVSNASSYSIQYKPSSGTTWTTTNSTTNSLSLSALTASTAYDIKVMTNCSSGSSAYSSITNFTTISACPTPSSLTASNVSITSASLSWTATTGASSYTIQYKPTTSSTWASTTSTTNSKSLASLASATPYDVQVMATCTGTTSNYTSTYNFTTQTSCGTPSNVAAGSLTTTGATITWTALSGASSYTIQYKLATATVWSSTTATTNSKALTALTSGATYNVQVKANCGTLYSSVVSFTTPTADCGTPSNVAAGSLTTTGATITWTAPSGASSYTIQYKLATATVWSSTTATTNSSVLTSLTAGSTYNVQVKANCGTLYSSVVSFTTPTADCGTPSNVAAGSLTTTGATITWTAISGASSYTIQYKLATATVWSSTSSTTTSKALTSLTSGSTYNVKVKASCGTLYSSVVNFTTLPATCGTPTAPVMSNIGAGGATSTWTAVSGANSYTVQYKLSSATTWSSVNATTATYTLSGLTASSSYDVKVMTNCSVGSSSYSATTTFSTSAATTTCNVPTGLSVSGLSMTGATITWTTVSGATNYTIQYKLATATVWSSTSSTTTSKTLSGLVAGSNYEVKVRSNCSGGSSAYSTPVPFSTPSGNGSPQEGYGLMSVDEKACGITNDASHIWIEEINVGDLYNSSGSNDGYADFSMLTAEAERHTRLPIEFKSAYWNINTPQYWTVWIDYDHDKVFDNLTEQVLQIQTNGNELATSIYIDKQVPIGETLMRISLHTDKQLDACTSGEGETEDYTIKISDYKATNFVPIIEPLWLASIEMNQTVCKNVAEMAYSINDQVTFLAYKGQENLLKLATNRAAAYTVWIDYNGNGDFDTDELVEEGEAGKDFVVRINIPDYAQEGETALLVSIEGDNLTDVEQYQLVIQADRPQVPIMANECKEVDLRFDYSIADNDVFLHNLSTGNFDQVTWDMGDGTQLNSLHAAHHYQEAGNYQFTLTLSNTTLGCDKMFTGEVRVFGENKITNNQLSED